MPSDNPYAAPQAVEMRFDRDDANSAGKSWGFNCGPAALCAMLGMTPDEVRPHLGDFEAKRYTNPTLMADILRGLGVRFRRCYECAFRVDGRPRQTDWPDFGLIRIQWGGPWTRDGVPMAARYRHTHWIGFVAGDMSDNVFDVNAMCIGGWLSMREWMTDLVPWLLPQVEPKADGSWWPTHCWEIDRATLDRLDREHSDE